jgi:dTDP-4-dehydrorhamnose 3,5-epimerase-like enzyme
MRLNKLEMEGAFAIAPQPAIDERGDFAHIFCATARRIRWNDPRITMDWPIKKGVTLSARGRQLSAFDSVALQC